MKSTIKINIVTSKLVNYEVDENGDFICVLDVLVDKDGKINSIERREFNSKSSQFSRFNPVEHIKNPKYVVLGTSTKPGTMTMSSQDGNNYLEWIQSCGWELDEEDINSLREKKLKKLLK